ncbi:hypothetical protein [Quadrisphaera sp. DSM 44207]|uniref:hypothetical protein n=1 Tax=Quadrisphaera sp. DSM 44207 TaxID=1881057 RepID=UPI00088EA107|nr:hypothetical protein [Quadrisphaera sp. DSM 44207]SDQ50681.1 hypothetical protein SAMN05428996_1970 [Quadrisphaera sp. DSM 44207]
MSVPPAGQAALLAARALLVHDLGARGLDTAAAVSAVEDAAAARAWWVREWPDGARYVAGQLAQDVQEVLVEDLGVRWPLCPSVTGAARVCGQEGAHVLHVAPDLGEDPHWVCEESGAVVAPLGALRGAAAG